MALRRYPFLLLLLFSISPCMQAQTEGEWAEWETLFSDMDQKGGRVMGMEAGLIGGTHFFDASMKRQLQYYGEYRGRGSDFGAYFQKKIAGSFALKFSLLYSQFQFSGQSKRLDSTTNLDVQMGLLRFPVSAVFTVNTKWVQPQFHVGFNMGHLVRTKGYITYRQENILPAYWSSTITSGLIGGLGLQTRLWDSWHLRAGSEFSLMALNPFDQLKYWHLNLSLGYIW